MRLPVRRRSSRRGVSGLIASIFLFAMLFTTGAAYILFVTDSQFQLQEAAEAALERNIQRTSESVRVTTLELGDGDLGVSLTNTGGEPVQLKQIFVVDSNDQMVSNIQSAPLPITLNVRTATASPIDTNVTIQQDSNYTVSVVSDRGSLFSGAYPEPSMTLNWVVQSEVAKAIGSISMDTTTLQYSQDWGTTWNQGWSIPPTNNTIWRINVTNMTPRDIYLSNYSSFLFLEIVKAGGGGQIQPRTFYIASSDNSTTYPNLEDPDFIADGGAKIPGLVPDSDPFTVTIYLKLSDPGEGGGRGLEPATQYLTTLELFGKYGSPTSSDFYGQSLPFVGVLTDP
jgi:archaellum component FlaF (FlaF/FlaG flagellin family)